MVRSTSFFDRSSPDQPNATDELDESLVDMVEIFVYEEKPLQVHIHRTLDEDSVYDVNELRQKLEDRGANTSAEQNDARFIIVNPHKNESETLKAKYSVAPHIWVVNPEWIDQCITAGTLIHPRGSFQKIGYGKRGKRTPFINRDERNLVKYLACRAPFVIPNQGGTRKTRFRRSGMKFYEELVHSHRHWAKRHTIKGWRSHFEKNADELEEKIAEYVSENPKLLKNGLFRGLEDFDDDRESESGDEDERDKQVFPRQRKYQVLVEENFAARLGRSESPDIHNPKDVAFVLGPSDSSESEEEDPDAVQEEEEEEEEEELIDAALEDNGEEEDNRLPEILRVPEEYSGLYRNREPEEGEEEEEEEEVISEPRWSQVSWPPRRDKGKAVARNFRSFEQPEPQAIVREKRQKLVAADEADRSVKGRQAEASSSSHVSRLASNSSRQSVTLEEISSVSNTSQLRRNMAKRGGPRETGLLSPPKTQPTQAIQPSPRSLPRIDLSQTQNTASLNTRASEEPNRMLTRRRARQKAALEE